MYRLRLSCIPAALLLIFSCAGAPETDKKPVTLQERPWKPILSAQSGHRSRLRSLHVSSGGDYLLSRGREGSSLKLWHSDGRLLRNIKEAGELHRFSADGRTLAYLHHDGSVLCIEELSGRPLLQQDVPFPGVRYLTDHPAGEGGFALFGMADDRILCSLVSPGSQRELEIPLPDGHRLRGEPCFYGDQLFFPLSHQGRAVLGYLSPGGAFSLLELPAPAIPAPIKQIFRRGESLILFCENGALYSYRIHPRHPVPVLEHQWQLREQAYISLALSSSGVLALSTADRIELYQLGDDPAGEYPDYHGRVRRPSDALAISPDGQTLYYDWGDGRIRLYNVPRLKGLRFFPEALGLPRAAALELEHSRLWIDYGNRLELRDLEGRMLRRDVQDPPDAVELKPLPMEGKEWKIGLQGDLLRLERAGGRTLYLASSADGLSWISMAEDGQIIASGRGGSLIGFVRGAELYPAALFEGQLLRGPMRQDGFDPPSLRLLERDFQRLTDMKTAVRLRFSLEAGDASPAAYQVEVNGVPLYPGEGKAVDPSGGICQEELELYEPVNRIRLRALDQQGLSSLPVDCYGFVKKAKAGEVYFAGIGVSKDSDGQTVLPFADRDAGDFLHYFRNLVFDRSFAVEHQLYHNNSFTSGSIEAIREYFMHTGADDTLVLFVAAPLLSSKQGWQVPLSDGALLPLSRLDRCFDGVPARRRLLLLNLVPSLPASDDPLGPDFAEELVPGIREGAIVFLYEDDKGSLELRRELENGVFSDLLLKVLTDSSSDRNGNRFLDSRELHLALETLFEGLPRADFSGLRVYSRPHIGLFLPLVRDIEERSSDPFPW